MWLLNSCDVLYFDINKDHVPVSFATILEFDNVHHNVTLIRQLPTFFLGVLFCHFLQVGNVFGTYSQGEKF